MTRLLAYAGEAALAIWRNRTRSVLTILGMIIGTASIIAVFGISRGATNGISAMFASFGVTPIYIFPDPTQDYPQTAQVHFRDVNAVAAALGDQADEVLPLYQQTWQVRYGNKTRYIAIDGDGAFHPDTIQMQEGRKFDQTDVDSAARVAVLTNDIAEKLFGDQPALGKELAINGTHFIVVGVYPKLQGSFFNSLFGSNSIAIPYTTYHRVFPGEPSGLLVYPAEESAASQVTKITESLLKHLHGARTAYQDQNGAAAIKTFENVLTIIGTGLSAIGGVALLVAGIGIMNIMLVSVTERTREIGIRKSIGAARADIALQFLLEALLLALAGGGIGTLLGLGVTIGAAEIISRQLGSVIIPYVLIIAIAVFFSVTVGTVFGTYPAMRAASMDPVEALRS